MSDIVDVIEKRTKVTPEEIKKEIPIKLYRKGSFFLHQLKDRENKKYNLEVSNDGSILKRYFLNKKGILNVLLPFGLENILNCKINVKEVNEPSVILVTRIKSKKGRKFKLSELDKNTYYRLKFYYPNGSGTIEFKKLESQELFKEIGGLEENFGEGRLQYYVSPIKRKK